MQEYGGYDYTVTHNDIYEKIDGKEYLRGNPYIQIEKNTNVPWREIMRENDYTLPSQLRQMINKDISIPVYTEE